MDREQLKADHPDTFEAIRKEGQDAGLQQGVEQGAKAERERIAAIDAEAMPGHEALTAQAKADGWNVDKYLAACARADRDALKAAAVAHKADAPAPVKDTPPADGDGQTIKRAEFNALPSNKRMALSKSGVKVID